MPPWSDVQTTSSPPPSSLRMFEFFSRRPRYRGNSCQLLASTALFCQSRPRVHDHRWGLKCRSTQTWALLSGSAFSSPQQSFNTLIEFKSERRRMKPSVSQRATDNSVSHKHAAFMDFSVTSGPCSAVKQLDGNNSAWSFKMGLTNQVWCQRWLYLKTESAQESQSDISIDICPQHV